MILSLFKVKQNDNFIKQLNIKTSRGISIIFHKYSKNKMVLLLYDLTNSGWRVIYYRRYIIHHILSISINYITIWKSFLIFFCYFKKTHFVISYCIITLAAQCSTSSRPKLTASAAAAARAEPLCECMSGKDFKILQMMMTEEMSEAHITTLANLCDKLRMKFPTSNQHGGRSYNWCLYIVYDE